MKEILFTGSGVAIVTPFHAGAVNFPAFGRLIDRQIDGGTDVIIVCGTTGEAATMTQKERMGDHRLLRGPGGGARAG